MQQDFSALTGHAAPLLWQRRLFERLLESNLPEALDLPTGLGKTSVMALWLLALGEQMRNGGQPKLPRRLVYVVDRRAVVDQATGEAMKLQQALDERPELAWMRAALRLEEGESLPVSTLRGKLADNRAWLSDPSKPAIIVGTVDMTGSRLLFSGYGTGRRMRPVHAALLGVDSLFVLDESHLAPSFQKLLEQISGADDRLWPQGDLIRPLRLLPLSATGEKKEGAFTLSVADKTDDLVKQRLHAVKRLELKRIAAGGKKDALAGPLAEAAWTRAFDEDGRARKARWQKPRPVRVMVYASSRMVAQKVADLLRKRAKGNPACADVELFTGARRVKERQQAAERLQALGFMAAGQEAAQEAKNGEGAESEGADSVNARPAFLVATAAGEVGVDMDADAMVGDLVALERMIQRFGRVNRQGELMECPILVLVDDEAIDEEKDEEKRRCLRAVVRALEKLGGDASPAALMRLKKEHPALVERASTPPPLYPPLELPTVEAWAMTSLREHTGRPDIQPWLRGWVEDEPRATIIWRQYLPWEEDAPRPAKAQVEAFFHAARPHLLEMLEAKANFIANVLTSRAKRWKKALEKDARVQGMEPDPGKIPALIALTPAGDFSHGWTLAELAAEKLSTLQPRISGRLLVAVRDLGGLDAQGLLDKGAAVLPDTVDAGWGGDWLQSAGFRVFLRQCAESDANGGADGGWRQAHVLVLQRNADDGDAVRELVVEVSRKQGGQEGDLAIAACRYHLEPHLQDVAQAADGLAERLGLAEEWRKMLRLAGKWHDVGKNRTLWQLAANAPLKGQQRLKRRRAMDEAYAKTTGPFRAALLGGYRHEFGSLLDALEDEQLNALPQEQRDIILHLVAAHHGGARPLLPAIDPVHRPALLRQEVTDIALRYARLQRRFGPWGLAWLEELLRAADRMASAAIGKNAAAGNEARKRAHG